MAKVTLTALTRTDTVYIKQQGPLQDRIILNHNTFEVPSEGGTYTTEVECYRCPDALQVQVSSDMLTASVADGILTVSVLPAKSRDPKSYKAVVYYIDGWGERASVTATFNQKAKSNKLK